jgi:flagellar hook-associated protein 1 FlgK
MSLSNTLNVAKSALAVNATAVQTTGNNLANATTPGYSRQRTELTPGQGHTGPMGERAGGGVNLVAVRRQIDDALNARLRSGVSDEKGAEVKTEWLGRAEAIFQELGDNDLSSQFSSFFSSWSELANKPQDTGLREVVVQEGQNTAGKLRQVGGDLRELVDDAETRLRAEVEVADGLATRIADLNSRIAQAESGGRNIANDLRDSRDAAVRELAELVNINTTPTDGGGLDVHIGSEPLIVGQQSFGLYTTQRPRPEDESTQQLSVRVRGNNAEIDARGGSIGGLVEGRDKSRAMLDQIDGIAGTMIFQLNNLHASGQGVRQMHETISPYEAIDTTASLASTDTGLPFQAHNGSFVVRVRDGGSGLVSSTLIDVDLDGLGSDLTLDGLATELDGVDGISAQIVGGKLKVAGDGPGVSFSFSQDSSGVLASVGLARFFDGHDASSMAVRTDIVGDPQRLAASDDGAPAGNGTARAIAALEQTTQDQLGGRTIQASYESLVNDLTGSTANARNTAEAARTVRETLEAQRESLSGVSLDEEAADLVRFQRAYQGAARLIAAVDEMMQTIINLT